MTKVLTFTALTLVIGFAGITYGALESGDVIEVETWNSIESNTRVTRIWFVRSSDSILLEAGYWLRGIGRRVRLSLQLESRSRKVGCCRVS